MFGCDLVGQLSGSLRLKTRTAKWTQTFLLAKFRQSVAVQARALYNMRFGKSLSVHEFTEGLIEELMAKMDKPRKRAVGPEKIPSPTTSKEKVYRPPPPPPEWRHWTTFHRSEKSEQGKKVTHHQGHCRICRRSVKTYCRQCRIFLCVGQLGKNENDCFMEFHTKQE